MKPGVDLSTLTKAERIVLVVALALFLNALIPYWYRVRTPSETFLHNGGLYGWGIVTAMAGFISAAIVVFRHAKTPASFKDRGFHVLLGAAASAGLIVHGITAREAVWIGFWIECILAAALTIAGLARVRERARGWV